MVKTLSYYGYEESDGLFWAVDAIELLGNTLRCIHLDWDETAPKLGHGPLVYLHHRLGTWDPLSKLEHLHMTLHDIDLFQMVFDLVRLSPNLQRLNIDASLEAPYQRPPSARQDQDPFIWPVMHHLRDVEVDLHPSTISILAGLLESCPQLDSLTL